MRRVPASASAVVSPRLTVCTCGSPPNAAVVSRAGSSPVSSWCSVNAKTRRPSGPVGVTRHRPYGPSASAISLGGLDPGCDQLRGAGHQPVQEDPYLLQDRAAQHAVDDLVPVVGDGALEQVVELGADVGDGPALRPVADDGPQVGADLPEDGWLLRQRRFPAEQGHGTWPAARR